MHDLVVLSVGLLPAYDPQPIYDIPVADDGFVYIPDPNISPTRTNCQGIFATGTAISPMDIVDSVVMAGAAAADAAAHIERHKNGGKTSIEETMEVVHA